MFGRIGELFRSLGHAADARGRRHLEHVVCLIRPSVYRKMEDGIAFDDLEAVYCGNGMALLVGEEYLRAALDALRDDEGVALRMAVQSQGTAA